MAGGSGLPSHGIQAPPKDGGQLPLPGPTFAEDAQPCPGRRRVSSARSPPAPPPPALPGAAPRAEGPRGWQGDPDSLLAPLSVLGSSSLPCQPLTVLPEQLQPGALCLSQFPEVHHGGDGNVRDLSGECSISVPSSPRSSCTSAGRGFHPCTARTFLLQLHLQ